MPMYNYVCSKCCYEFEKIEKVGTEIVECPKCLDKAFKDEISTCSFILKGGGWYSEGYSSSKKTK